MFSESMASPIRFPSTANLLINSLDRSNLISTTSTDFSINKNENILAGFFTRFGVVELVLDYSIPNIALFYGTNTLSITVGTTTQVITVPDGNYDVSAVMDAIKNELNTGSNETPTNPSANLFPNIEFSWFGLPGNYFFGAEDLTTPASPIPQDFIINDTPLARMLRLTRNSAQPLHAVQNPNLLPPQLKYLDFVCTNITYQQGLKDGSTSNVVRDVLYRWNFGWDNVYILDDAGYPINQGYLPFVQRRYLNFPKQVKWDTAQPIGQLNFQVYNSNGEIVGVNIDTTQNLEGKGSLEWSMGLLVSEQ
jgi:hypothetical protein